MVEAQKISARIFGLFLALAVFTVCVPSVYAEEALTLARKALEAEVKKGLLPAISVEGALENLKPELNRLAQKKVPVDRISIGYEGENGEARISFKIYTDSSLREPSSLETELIPSSGSMEKEPAPPQQPLAYSYPIPSEEAKQFQEFQSILSQSLVQKQKPEETPTKTSTEASPDEFIGRIKNLPVSSSANPIEDEEQKEAQRRSIELFRKRAQWIALAHAGNEAPSAAPFFPVITSPWELGVHLSFAFLIALLMIRLGYLWYRFYLKP